VLSFLWIPALGIFYLKLYWPLLKGIARNSAGKASKGFPWEFSMSEILRLLIIANLIFLLTRPWISEGTALYLISLMLIDVVLFHNDRKGLLTAIWVLALLFLIANNTLLVRFISPITSAAVPLDLDINNGPITGPIRTAIRLLLSFAFYFTVIKSLQIYWKSPKQVRLVAARLDPTKDFGPGPKVITVGICAHNEQGNIGKLLDNLKGQKLGKDIRLLEILVVSSGSTDSTNSIVSEKAKTFSKISLIIEPKRTGKSNAENIILSRAKGKVIVLISADSILKPDALNRLVGAFEGNVGGAIARAVPLNDNTGLVNFASRFIWELLNQTNLHLNSNGRLNSLGSDMLAIRSGIVVSIPDNVVNDDAYLGTVVRKKGFQISYVPDSVLYIRGPSTTSDFFKQRRRILYGHKQINSLFKVKPNILENIMLSDPFSAAMIFIKTCSRFSFYDLPKVPFVLALELVSQIKFRTDKKQNYILWDMVATSKQEIPDGKMELSP